MTWPLNFCNNTYPENIYSNFKILLSVSMLATKKWIGFFEVCTITKFVSFNQLPFKGQMKSECIYEIIDFPKYHWKNLINICPERLFRLGMLCTQLSRVALRIIKTNHIHLVYKTFQGRNLSNFFSGILENRWFHKYILTLSDL